VIYKADLLSRLGSQSGFGQGSGGAPQDKEKFEDCLSGHDERTHPGLTPALPVSFASAAQLVDDRGPRPQKRKRNRLIEATNEMFEHLLAVLCDD